MLRIDKEKFNQLKKALSADKRSSKKAAPAFGISKTTVNYIRVSETYEEYVLRRSGKYGSGKPIQMEIPETASDTETKATEPETRKPEQTEDAAPKVRFLFDTGEYRVFEQSKLRVAELIGTVELLMREAPDGVIVNWPRVLYMQKL